MMHSIHRAGTFVLALAAPLAASATAQLGAQPGGDEDVQDVQLPDTRIQADEPVSATLDFEAAALELRDMPVAVGLLDSERYLAGKASNQADIFRFVPGVWAASQNGGDDVFLSIRGSGLSNRSFGRSNIAVLDGFIPLSAADNGNTNQLVNLLAMDHIQVFRGGSALDLGVATTGGVINYVPNTGYTSDGVTLRGEYGTDRFWRTFASTGGVAGESDYYASLEIFNYDGFRNQSEVENYRFASNYGWQIDEDTETRFYLLAAKVDQELPGVLSKTAAENTPSLAGFFNNIIDADRNFEDLRFANKTTIRSADSTLTLGGYFTYNEIDHIPTPFTGFIDDEYHEIGVLARYEHRSEINGMENEFTAGIRAGLFERESNRWRHANGGRTRGINTLNADGEVTLIDTYVQDRLSLNDTTDVIAGFQFTYQDRDWNDNTLVASPPPIPPFPPQPSAVAGDQSFDETFTEFNPKLAITHDVSDDHLIFASLSAAAAYPSNSELTNQIGFGLPANSVDVEKAWTLEFGSRGQYKDFAYWDATLFFTKVDDNILTTQGPFPNTTVITNADTQRQGLELGFGFDFLKMANKGKSSDDALRLDVVINWFNFEFDDHPTIGDGQLPGIPEKSGFGSLEYHHSSGFYAGPNLQLADDYMLTFDGTGGGRYTVPALAIAGFRAGYRGENYSAYVEIQNMLDKDFIATGSIVPTSGAAPTEANVTPGNTRAIYFGAEWSPF